MDNKRVEKTSERFGVEGSILRRFGVLKTGGVVKYPGSFGALHDEQERCQTYSFWNFTAKFSIVNNKYNYF